MAYRARFDYRRTFGIELEGYGVSTQEIVEALAEQKISAYVGDGYNHRVSKWAIGRDGTVQHLFPLEIVSPIFAGEKGLEEVRKVCDVINRLDVKTDESCGFHVHWGVADYTGRNMINLLKLYGKYEKVLDFIFHPSRRGELCEFAHTLRRQDGMTWLYRLQGAFYTHAYQIAQEFEATQSTANRTSHPTARHHKVNVCAYNKYGTVEFRQHEGTFDYEKIENWIIFSQQLVNRAKDTTVNEGVATWESLTKTLALTELQLRESFESLDKNYLRQARDFYRKIYRHNKGEIRDAVNLGS